MKNENTNRLYTSELRAGYKGRKNEFTVLKNLNLTAAEGELIFLLGPNGCGKSTLLKTLCGLHSPLAGKIFIEENNLAELGIDELAKRISVVLTDNTRTSHIDVYSAIAMGRYPYTNWLFRFDEYDKQIIETALKVTGLAEFRDKPIDELSDGIYRKAMIARAVAQDTPIILLDEPTAFIDFPGKIYLMKLLRELTDTKNKTIILSTHDLDMAMQFADKIWLINSECSIIENIPEELVLNGEFENAFGKNEISFDKETGSFKINKKYNQSINLSGDSAGAYWTERALNRIGVASDNSASDKIVIHNYQNTLMWEVKSGSSSYIFPSINMLLQHFK